MPTRILNAILLSPINAMNPTPLILLDFNHPNYIWKRFQMMKFLIMSFSTAPCSFLSSMPKYYSQHPAVKHLQTVLHLVWNTKFGYHSYVPFAQELQKVTLSHWPNICEMLYCGFLQKKTYVNSLQYLAEIFLNWKVIVEGNLSPELLWRPLYLYMHFHFLCLHLDIGTLRGVISYSV